MPPRFENLFGRRGELKQFDLLDARPGDPDRKAPITHFEVALGLKVGDHHGANLGIGRGKPVGSVDLAGRYNDGLAPDPFIGLPSRLGDDEMY